MNRRIDCGSEPIFLRNNLNNQQTLARRHMSTDLTLVQRVLAPFNGQMPRARDEMRSVQVCSLS
jgi:hypothetical protein